MLIINTENKSQQTNFLPPSQESLAKVSPAGSETAESAGANEGENKKPVASVGKAIAHTVSPKKLAANKENAKKSPGPKTAAGKAMSSLNAVKHGLLSARLTQLNDQNAKDFAHVLAILQQDLQPVGVLEEILVEKIAYEYFRMATAAQHYNDAALYVVNTSGAGPGNLLRYDSMINRQLFQAINQLERLQRLRRGEDVPVPLRRELERKRRDEPGPGSTDTDIANADEVII